LQAPIARAATRKKLLHSAVMSERFEPATVKTNVMESERDAEPVAVTNTGVRAIFAVAGVIRNRADRSGHGADVLFHRDDRFVSEATRSGDRTGFQGRIEYPTRLPAQDRENSRGEAP